MPLVLKKRFKGSPLFSYHSFNSSFVGFSSMIWRSSYAIPFSSSHFFAFLQVLHFGYSKNNIAISFHFSVHFYLITEIKKNTDRALPACIKGNISQWRSRDTTSNLSARHPPGLLFSFWRHIVSQPYKKFLRSHPPVLPALPLFSAVCI